MIELKCWHSENGFRHVLARPGTKLLHVLVMDSAGLAVRTVPMDEQRYLREPIGGQRAWSTVCRQFANFGAHHGASKAAKRFLAEARKQGRA